MTTSFINNTNALDNVNNQYEYNMYVSTLDEEDLECLKYAQRLQKSANRQSVATPTPTDTDESKPESKKKRIRNINVAQ
ncbi:MAG: hypothetical protein ACKPKO_20875 [Candidatus Fonsibacter sp.]